MHVTSVAKLYLSPFKHPLKQPSTFPKPQLRFGFPLRNITSSIRKLLSGERYLRIVPLQAVRYVIRRGEEIARLGRVSGNGGLA
jgi:hypothetical protein